MRDVVGAQRRVAGPRPDPDPELDETLSALERISRALTVTTEGVDVLLQTITRTVAEVFDCPFVFLVVRIGETERCAMFPRTDRDHPLPGAWCVTESTFRSGGPMEVTCRAAEGCPCDYPRRLVTVPMSYDGSLQGSICLQTSGDADLDDYNSSVLQVLANQATVAIQNARLFEESQELRHRAEDLYRVAVEQTQAAERKRRELEMARDEIAAMEREQIVSSERERIARELHDDVAQILVSIGLNVEWCRRQLPADAVLQERLSCLKKLAREGLYEIRHTLLGLSPTRVGELGLVEALRKLVDDFEQISRIPAELEVVGEPRRKDDGTAGALYHICQEALYNVFKHARAEHVTVVVEFRPDRVGVVVVDDGVGFGAQSGDGEESVTFGLRNMRSRAEELGGSVVIERDGDRGTRVTAGIPG
ncbi:MAG TPA: GAF domain-containing sensor histidine kinase [Kineosporiaceae bacterium]|nr:GAF domain-containing sensor histidine kinase [Kineosporiaceae bacterium]